jgi:hypothetical protein
MRPLLLSLFIALGSTAFGQTVALTPSDKGLRIDINGRLFSEYVTSAKQRPFLYPIIGPSGENLARPWPKTDGSEEKEHPHHRGLWFTHGGANGIDYWGDGEKNGSIVHSGFSDVKAEGGTGSFVVKAKWVPPGADAVLDDERHITITALANDAVQIDYTVALTASAADVTFNDTKEGSMAIRVCPSLSIKGEGAQGHILTSEGAADKKAWGTRAKWCAFYGPDPKGNAVTLTMMDHPSNLRAPTYWHARDYGLFAANPFGLHDFEKSDNKTLGDHRLAKGSTLTQRYRIIIAKGEVNAAVNEAAYAEFAK